MTRVPEVNQFIKSLADAELPDRRSVNVYLNTTRCENLRRWFNTFEDTSQSTIFVGEALGRDGGAITGVPFVSPHVLTSTQDPWGEFGPETSYSMPVNGDSTQKERTATRFWKHVPGLLGGLPRPLTWNIFPFWPYSTDNRGRRINRAPTKVEVEFGEHWLVQVTEMFPNAHILSVGNLAQKTLKSLAIESHKIPHPSRGSDSSLVEQLSGAVANLQRDPSVVSPSKR